MPLAVLPSLFPDRQPCSALCRRPRRGRAPSCEIFAVYLSSDGHSLVEPYDLELYHDKLVSKCPLFTTEATGLAKASAVFQGEQTIPRLLDYCQTLGSDSDFRRMCVLDAITLNPDRHYGNFGFLFDNQTMAIVGMAPVFDNNRALFPELDEDALAAPDWYIDHCRPKLGRDFIITARGLMTDEIRADLEKLKDFQFENHPRIPIRENRLELLSSLVQRQISLILK